MRLLVAGGGTGGHLFPGIAVAEELLSRRGSGPHEVLFVGTRRGIEARVLPREGYRVEFIDVAGLKGGGPLGIARGLLRLPRSFVQSLGILRRFRPDLVVGVGGYASGPLVLAAELTGRPTALLEQNSVPGVTNRILGKIARRVFTAFEESHRHFPASRVRPVGNPIRAKLREALLAAPAATQQPDAASQQAADGVAAAGSWRAKALLVCGGSQGARPVNDLVLAAVRHLHETGALVEGGALAGLRLVHQTGEADRDRIAAGYRELGLVAETRAFIDDMASAYRAADLVLARAGATTIAELTALGRASILVPFPQAADDHQTKNARALEQAGAALLLPQAGLTGEALAHAAAGLLLDDDRREAMAQAARRLGRPDAARAVVDELLALVASRAHS